MLRPVGRPAWRAENQAPGPRVVMDDDGNARRDLGAREHPQDDGLVLEPACDVTVRLLDDIRRPPA
jgi:hypothetical protein